MLSSLDAIGHTLSPFLQGDAWRTCAEESSASHNIHILVRIMLEGGVAAPTPDDQDLVSVDIDVAIHGMIPAIHAFRPAAWRTNDVDPLG